MALSFLDSPLLWRLVLPVAAVAFYSQVTRNRVRANYVVRTVEASRDDSTFATNVIVGLGFRFQAVRERGGVDPFVGRP